MKARSRTRASGRAADGGSLVLTNWHVTIASTPASVRSLATSVRVRSRALTI